MKLVNFEDEKPPQGELVIVLQEMTGFCLREFHGDAGYDEHNNYDDSELENYCWASLKELRDQL